VEKTENSNLRVLHKFYFKVNETTVYIVTYGDVPEQQIEKGTEKIYEDVRNAVAGDSYNKLLREKTVTIDGISGREIEIDGNNGEFFSMDRFLVTKGRLYQVLAIAPKPDQSSTNILYFLNSFKLSDKK
jgi:hypothetical protein